MFKLKKIAFASLVILAVVIHAKATLVDSNSITKDGIEYYIETNKSVYNLGEDVELLYRITNLTEEEWGVMGIGSLRFIYVAPKGAEWFDAIWAWLEPAPPGPTGFTLQPNGSVEVSAVWPQIDKQGTRDPGDDIPVPTGIYTITARLNPTDTNVAVDVTIIPEPGSLILFVVGLPLANYINRRRRG